MSVVNELRSCAVRATRALPRFRGYGRLAKALNSYVLRAGGCPTTIAHMRVGHCLVLDLRVRSQAWAHFSGQYTDAQIKVLSSYLPQRGVFVDVGANIGFFSIPIAVVASRVG